MLFPSAFAPGQVEFYAALFAFGFIAKVMRSESRSYMMLLVAVVAYPSYETILVCVVITLMLGVGEFIRKAG